MSSQPSARGYVAPKAKFVVVDGEIVPFEQGTVHIASAAMKFGTAVFEGIRGYWNDGQSEMYLFRFDDHLSRLGLSQKFMRFDDPVPASTVRELTLNLIRANELRSTCHVMTTVYVSGFGPPTATGPEGLAVTAFPGGGPGLLETGAQVQVSSWQRVPDTAMPMRVKCNANYQNGRIAALQGKADGYDTVLLMNNRGKLAEGPGQCFFMIRDGKVVTPSVTSDILESITRDTVITLLAEEFGMPVEERDVDRTELLSADEAFFCGTAWEVTPIVSVDRLAVGTGQVGPIVKQLQARYFALTSGTSKDRPEWRTAVYD